MSVLCIDCDGNPIWVGDFVGYKDGYERTGKAVKMNGGYLELSVYDSETGDRFAVTVSPKRAWKEGGL